MNIIKTGDDLPGFSYLLDTSYQSNIFCCGLTSRNKPWQSKEPLSLNRAIKHSNPRDDIAQTVSPYHIVQNLISCSKILSRIRLSP